MTINIRRALFGLAVTALVLTVTPVTRNPANVQNPFLRNAPGLAGAESSSSTWSPPHAITPPEIRTMKSRETRPLLRSLARRLLCAGSSRNPLRR